MTIFDDIMKSGSLELLINQAIDEIPSNMRLARSPDFKKYFMITKDEDFVFGYVLGRVIARCEMALGVFGGGKPLGWNEYEEIWESVSGKLPQIRDRIFDQG